MQKTATPDVPGTWYDALLPSEVGSGWASEETWVSDLPDTYRQLLYGLAGSERGEGGMPQAIATVGRFLLRAGPAMGRLLMAPRLYLTEETLIRQARGERRKAVSYDEASALLS